MDSDSSSHSDDPGTSMDTDTALHIDTGTPMGTESRSNDNPGMNMDSELLVPEGNLLAGDEATTQRCVNCGTDLLQRRRHTLVLIDVRSIIQQWIAPRLIENDTLVCHSCWTLALHHSRTQASNDGSSTSGHRRNTCVNCGCSLMRTRSHTLNSNTERESQIRAIVMEQIAPRQLHGSDKICHPCWQRIDRAATRSTEVRHPNNNQPSIILPMYTRASGSQQFCFYPDCHSTQRLAAPKWLRIKLFTDYNFYVPQNCRICSFHLYNDNWEVLSNIQQPIHSFNAEHIQDFATFVNERQMVLDFSNIETLSNELTHYWIGLSKEQFQQLYLEVPGMQAVHRNKLALAGYLMKLRTGDSDQRIATLLNIPRTTLMRLMGKARDVLERAFVPNNLGINHLTRTEISERNLLIPNGLFGGVNRQPIIIIDGTYLYVQKSSNYMYQKDTYSLHKYRNLIKPLLIVCSDGYIVDVLGPYLATTSDANIILNEFNEETKPLRRYFQAGDVFILDRGFRDAVPLLRQCNYSANMPASLQQGETQLSTLAANKSRAVTVCRWVVEIVNGIFKQSFKLLRHEFFNRASLHAMTDFRIAAALINRFHQRVRDREDAAQILEIINENMYLNNNLADFVIENNLNRRRTDFVSINVNTHNVSFPRLEYSELILIACGTYQLKQARSYYGEHIRGDGIYTIELCRNSDSNLLDGFPLPILNCRLLRCKIKSRHVGRKIYFVYIIYDETTEGRGAIKNYYCNCIVGRRTVGCCAHIMTILWFLGWARHQNHIDPPAQFLDHVLLTYEAE